MRWVRWVGVAVVVVLGASGCGGGSSDPAVPVVIGSQAAFSGADGVLQSPEQQAGDQASAAVRRYYEVRNEVETNVGVDPARLGEVTVEPMTRTLVGEVVTKRSAGDLVTGGRRVVAVTVGTVVAPKDEDGVPVAGEAKVDLRVCLDWTGYGSVTRDGAPTDPALPESSLAKPTLVNSAWPDPGGWRVSWDWGTTAIRGYESCDAR